MLRFLGELNRYSIPTSTHSEINMSEQTAVTALETNITDGERLKYFIGRIIQAILHYNCVLTKKKINFAN